MRMQSVGFSLIELMIVVSILSILAITAIPSYQHYTERARFAELITAVHPYKTAVALALQQGAPINDLTHGKNGIPPPPKPTKHLAQLAVNQGIITAHGTTLLKQVSYVLTPNEEGTQWTIGGTCLETGLCHD